MTPLFDSHELKRHERFFRWPLKIRLAWTYRSSPTFSDRSISSESFPTISLIQWSWIIEWSTSQRDRPSSRLEWISRYNRRVNVWFRRSPLPVSRNQNKTTKKVEQGEVFSIDHSDTNTLLNDPNFNSQLSVEVKRCEGQLMGFKRSFLGNWIDDVDEKRLFFLLIFIFTGIFLFPSSWTCVIVS